MPAASPVAALSAAVPGAPPARLAGVSLFFDFDGTLAEIAPTRDAVRVAPSLIESLDALTTVTRGAVAIVSGRSIAQLDALIGPFARRIAIAGSHGAERRLPGEAPTMVARPPALDAALAELAAYAGAQGLLFEDKSLGGALHYRAAPAAEAAAIAAAGAIAAAHDVHLQRGRMMVELRADGDKGRALDALLATPAMAGTRPLFFGDDVTDEDGFVAAAAAGGGGVLVGDTRPTAALWHLSGVPAVHDWIGAAIEAAR